jgi:hypothetical protein
MSGCGTSRDVTSSRERIASYETTRAEVKRDSVVVAERDTIREVTTVTIQLGAMGDTVFQSVVTDRERGWSRDAIATRRTKTEVVRDTVYVERRDSIEIRSRPEGGQSKNVQPFLNGLKWVFGIVVAICVVVILLRVKV